LFEIEVPEIYNGMVEIKSIVREAGSRSKVAVWAKQEGVDAVGSCVGLRGIRIQNIVNELQGEKIDVVQWHRDTAVFISNALNPSQTIHVGLDEEGNATVVVQEKQLSLAIGREGQNARLAAKLTGWKIDILSSAEADMERLKRTAPVRTEKEPVEEAPVTEPVVADKPVAAEAEVEAEPAETPVASEAEPVAETIEATETEAVPASTEEAPEPVLASVEESVTDVSWEEEETTTEIQEEEQEGIPITDDVWQVPQLVPSGDSQIMFAEDLVIPGRGGEGRRRGGRGRGNMEETNKVKRAAKKRKGASSGVQT
jgi:N utilization substance protein A